MPSWHGRSKGSPLGYRIFVFILKAGGVTPAYLLLRFVVLHYLIFSYKTTKHTFNYFHTKLHYGFLRSLYKVCANYYLLGQTIIDKVVLMSGMPNKFTFDFDGEEHLKQIIGEKKGGLLLSAHIGNWEIAGQLLKKLGAGINIVMFDGEREQIKEYIGSVTGKTRVNIILIKNDMSHIFEINQALRNNELVCMHADRYMEKNKTITGQFLGLNAKFPLGPFLLAAKFKVPVCYVFAMKESKLHYHFFASRPMHYQNSNKQTGPPEILHDFISEMESKVKRYPAQWYNYYNFWQ